MGGRNTKLASKEPRFGVCCWRREGVVSVFMKPMSSHTYEKGLLLCLSIKTIQKLFLVTSFLYQTRSRSIGLCFPPPFTHRFDNHFFTSLGTYFGHRSLTLRPKHLTFYRDFTIGLVFERAPVWFRKVWTFCCNDCSCFEETWVWAAEVLGLIFSSLISQSTKIFMSCMQYYH